MASRRKKSRLTSGEMEIMSLLWEHGGLTIAETHEKLDRPIGYTTVQTRLNRLADKKLVRKTKERPARYEPTVTSEDVGANHLDDLVAQVAGGKVVPLVAHLVNDRRISEAELSELKEIIRNAERRLQEEES